MAVYFVLGILNTRCNDFQQVEIRNSAQYDCSCHIGDLLTPVASA